MQWRHTVFGVVQYLQSIINITTHVYNDTHKPYYFKKLHNNHNAYWPVTIWVQYVGMFSATQQHLPTALHAGQLKW